MRQVGVAARRGVVRASVRAHAEASQITVVTDAPAFLTRSRRLRKPSPFKRLTDIAGNNKGHLTAMVLGAKDVLVATHGERRGTIALAARLADVEVGSTADRLAAEIDDDGVTVTGFPTTVAGTTADSFFVGLGSLRGTAARATLEDAVRRGEGLSGTARPHRCSPPAHRWSCLPSRKR